jgi:hypothetical protein
MIMKTARYLFLTLLIALFGMSAEAQQRNVLQVTDVTSQIGNVQLPVSIENTDEIVGAQFDLTLPAGVTAQPVGTLANRSDGHTVTVSQLSSGAYRVLLHSGANRPLRGQSGVVMYLPVTIPDTFEEGSEHQLTISNAVLGKATGENVLTEAVPGKIRISKLPDLTVKNITFDKQTLSPGDRLVCSWQVENVGELATNGGWSEQLSLVSTDGTQSKLIATTHYDDILDASGIVSRQAEVTLPFLLGIDGQVKLQVRIVPDSETGESASALGNNIQTANGLIYINKVLTFELSPSRIVENSGARIMLKLNRSGKWAEAETFTLTATADSRIIVPASITIPAGQSGAIVYISLTDNDVLDDESTVTVSAKGNGYAKVSQQLFIEDNEYPNLTVIASKSVITEGETFQLTITASRTSAAPLTVTLTSENNKRFTFPQTLTIPAGETSTTVTVETVDDELPSLDLSNAFTASAPSYNKGEVIVLLQDNDMPVLELTLTPNTVSEGVGPVAVAGVLRRTTNTNSKITVKLTDDADGSLYFGNRTLELAKGVQEVHFNFGPVDNTQVDGDRTYTITAAVWLSSCSCNASGESAGYVTAKLNVLDNDGPALTLSSSLSTVKEGDVTTLTISRNTTDTTTPLTVNISSDYDEALTYDHTVTISAGQQSVEVNVASTANDIQGDSHTVVFTVQAEGYSTGTCYVMVTDQTLPDARISSISADVTEAEVGTKAILSFEVINSGVAVLPIDVPIKIYRQGNNDVEATIYTSESIPVGGTLTLTKAITLPQTVGTHKYYAVVNEENKIQELTYNNNTSADVSITTVAPFSAVVSTDKSIYMQGEKVIITGQLTGKNIANTPIDVYVINDGARQVQSVTTDDEGAFSYEWQLYTQQSGRFIVGACYPDEELKVEIASFDVYGLRRIENDNITCDVINGDTYEGSFSLINPGILPLSGVKAEVLSAPENCNASVFIPSTIDGNQIVNLSYQLQGTEPTDGNNWDEIKVYITTNEGVTLDVTLYFYCRSAKGRILASTNNIVTNMTQGKTCEYILRATNTGRGSTGTITLALPDFIKSLSGNTLPALEQNGTIDIPLTFTPAENMPLNIPVTGHFGINCENGDGAVINFSLTPVSEETGTLLIDVCDENTYYTVEAPHLGDAQVVVRDYGSNAIVSQGQTDSAGEYAVILPSGYYNLFVTAENHDSYICAIYVAPGVVTKQTVNLSIESIKVNWSVEETEIEDEYEIVTTIKYETNVPTPIVELDIPNRIYTENLSAGESLIFYATLTNKGLITAFNTSLTLPSQTDDLVWEPLTQNEGLEITPQQSILIPFKVTRMANDYNGRRKARSSNNGCHILTLTRSAWKCGSDWKWHEYKVPVQYEVCPKIEIHHEDSTIVRISPIEPPIIIDPWWIDPVIPIINVPNVPVISFNHCIPCLDFYGKKLINCGISLIPISFLGCTKGGYDCGHKIINKTGGWRRNTNCVLTAIGCAAEVCTKSSIAATPATAGSSLTVGAACKAVGWITNIISCLVDFTEPCHPDEAPTSSRRRAPIEYVEPGYITVLRQTAGVALKEVTGFADVMLEYFGDSVWIKNTTIEEQFELLTELAVNTNEYFTIEELRKYKPEEITASQFATFVERLNNSTRYELTGEDSDNRIHQEIIDDAWENVGEAEQESINMGYVSVDEMFQIAFTESYKKIVEKSESVCATISLQFSQSMTMTRQAFRGTLTVFNGHEDTAMQDVKLNLVVTNKFTCEVATSHDFQINAESLNGFAGELNLGNGWTLDANETGTATILFIPTKYAAPKEPIEWSFAGTLSYIDPFTGLEVTRELFPVTLTVKPSPELDLAYFMQRDIYGDDPLTEEEVEPMKPAEFALLINNKGYGDATNVRMVTPQPEIVDNEKGLAVKFELISSQVNGDSATLSFGKTIANDFGTIPAHSQAYAQWWLTSTLLGHFTDYQIEATHVTSYGNEYLSLLDTVTIHEMIHGFTVKNDGDKPLHGYLVNDIADADDMPDMLYFTDATQQGVYLVKEQPQIIRRSDTEYVLTVKADNAGWNYGSVFDPTSGRQKLVKVVRADGTEVNIDNIWQTDRTLRDGKDWLYENRLHFVGNMSADGETFYLTFESKPKLELAVESYAGVPEENTVLKEQLTTVTVKFNKPIKAETFTTEDITLNCQGVAQDASKIVIEKLNEQEFKLSLGEATLNDGYYVLTVQTAEIEDTEGFKGSAGKQATWIQYIDGKVALKVTASPAEGGTVTPASGRYDYDSNVTLTATASEGYDFTGWSLNGERVSADNEFSYRLTGDTELMALFTIKHYNVTVSYDPTQGTVEGAATGIYDYGTQLLLTAKAAEGYQFDGWKVGEEVVSTEATLEWTVTAATIIEATFGKKEQPNVTVTFPADGICTFSTTTALDFSALDGWVKAYCATSYTSESVKLKEIDKAAKGEGLILVGTPDETVVIPVAETEVEALEGNKLTGTAYAPYEVTGENVYVLSDKTGITMFHKAKNGLVIPRYKAYLEMDEDNGASRLSIIWDESTLIEMMKNAINADDRHYGLDGRILHPKAKGVHVIKGEKRIVK